MCSSPPFSKASGVRSEENPRAEASTQGFSRGNSQANPKDPRNLLPFRYAEILAGLNREYSLKFFVFENVMGLTNPRNIARFRTICRAFEKAGFNVFHGEMDAQDFGVAQLRRRLFSDEMRREHLRGAWTRTLNGIGLALFVIVLIEVKMRRARAFARKAVAVHGTVTRLREHRGKSGSKTYTVFFEYRTPSREMVTCSTWLLGIKPEGMAVGRSLVVLFDPGRPRKGRLMESLSCVDRDSLGRKRRR